MQETVEKRLASPTPKRIVVGDRAMKGVFIAMAAVSVLALIAIFIFLLVQGAPAIHEQGFFSFLFGSNWDVRAGRESFQIFPMLLTTLVVALMSTAIGVAIGIFTAVFIYKYCPKKLKGAFRQIINLLAGIPSVVYGLFGMLVIMPFMGAISGTAGSGLLTGSLVLGLMIIPVIVAVSYNALEAVPKEIYEGALALGGNKERAIFKAVFPAAKSGILTGVVLGIGRAIGETMAISMVIGGFVGFPNGLFGTFETLTSAIQGNYGYAGNDSVMGGLVAIGVVLFLFSFILNLIFMSLKRRGEKRNRKATFVDTSKRIPVLWHIGFGLGWFFGKIKFGIGWFFKKIWQGIKWFFIKIKFVALISLIRRKIDKRWAPEKQVKSRSLTMRAFVYIFAAITLAALLGIIVFVTIRGAPHLTGHFLFGTHSAANPSLGPAFVGTLAVIGVGLAIALPIGIGTAIFLSEYARKSKAVHYIHMAIETLAGVPSIVYGLFGYVLFFNLMGMGHSLLGGGLTVAIMILPTLIRTIEESLRAVPDLYREGSLALGAGKVRTTFAVVVPTAAGGIVTAVILSIGRIIAESAALLFTVGMIAGMPAGIMSGGITLSLSIVRLGMTHPHLASATAVVLLIFVLLLNLAASGLGLLLNKNKTKNRRQKTRRDLSYASSKFSQLPSNYVW